MADGAGGRRGMRCAEQRLLATGVCGSLLTAREDRSLEVTWCWFLALLKKSHAFRKYFAYARRRNGPWQGLPKNSTSGVFLSPTEEDGIKTPFTRFSIIRST